MKNELFFSISNQTDRKLTSLCRDSAALKIESQFKFFILPDRQMSFLKILDLPPAQENKLRNIVRFQMKKIYPGNINDVSFDFIPFKTKKGWKIVLYILKKKYLKELTLNKKFGGIVLPLQLISVQELQSLSNLIIYYPGMVEIWKLTGGIPEGVERHGRGVFSINNLIAPEYDIFNPEKLMVLYPDYERPELELKNIRVKEFSRVLDSIRMKNTFFPDYSVPNSDKITPFIVVTTFFLSLILLVFTTFRQQEFSARENTINMLIEAIQKESVQNKDALGKIEKLDSELKTIKGNAPINVYNLLLRTGKAIDPNSNILSFGLKGSELALTLNSKNALNNLTGIKKEFGNVSASNIRTLENGNESYTLWVEIEQ